MIRRRAGTMDGGGRRLGPIILGYALAFSLSGCVGTTMMRTPQEREFVNSSKPPPPPIVIASPAQHPAKKAASQELGSETAAAMPAVKSTTPTPADPVASALIRSMVERMGARAVGDDGRTRISLDQLRNQSRAGAAEYKAFCQRLTEILNAAGQSSNLEFSCDSDHPAQYHIQGTAYLINTDGFDAWELFLSMTPNNVNWTIWEAGRPIRVLRQPRTGQPQILP